MRFWKFLLPLLISTLCLAAQQDRITSAIDSSQTTPLAKSLHPQAQPQYDLGRVDPSMRLSYVTLLMTPSPSQQKALDQLLAQQQDRTSPLYHQWLTPQQFADRFGLSQNDLNKVTGWLRSEGFQILSVGGGRNSVSISGTAGQVQHAFGTEIHRYKVRGEEHFANSTPLMMPAALNGIVKSVMGVHSFLPRPASQGRGTTGMRNARPDYYDANFIFPNFLAPGDLATIYDITPLYSASTPIDGTGQKLAIVGQTDIYLADINDFRSGFGLNPIPTTGAGSCTTNSSGIVISPCNTTHFQYVLVAGSTDPGTTYACGDLGESDLDIEWSGAVARNAQIVFVNSPVRYGANCSFLGGGGVNASLSAVINPPSGPALAPVVSMSYGACEAEAGDLETLLLQGNAEGVTIVNSSGDAGAATCDRNPPNNSQPFSPAVNGLAVSYPASSPEVTGVGGTAISLADDSYPTPSTFWSTTIGANGGTAVTYIPELAWNDDVAFAQYCQAPISSDTFCKQGGTSPTPGWVPLTSTATAAQVQEDIWTSISGGGASNCFTQSPTGMCTAGFAQPAWQKGLKVASAPSGVRYVPDVSFFASPNFPGYIFCTAQNPPGNSASTCVGGISSAVDNFQSIVGGTSVSSPVFAGILTLLNQYVVATGFQSTPGLGNVNPMLYTLAATPSNNAFHTVTSGDNNVYCQPNTPAGQPSNVQCPAAGVLGYSASNFDAATHFNLVTGLGSVNTDALFLAWAGALTAPDFTLAAGSASPTSVPAGQSASVTLTIAPVNGSTQTINFTNSTSSNPQSCSAGLPAGALCSFNPGSVTLDGTNSQTVTLTITTTANMKVPSGVQTITVTGISGGTSHTATVSLTVTATNQTFSLTTNAGTFTTAVGGSAPVSVTVTGTNGFIVGSGAGATTALPLTYSCTGSPSLATAEISCAISPGNGQPTNATAVTVTLTTTAPTAQLRPPLGGSRIFYALLLPGLFGVVFVAGSRTRGLRLLSLIVVLGFSTLWLGSCGGQRQQHQPEEPRDANRNLHRDHRRHYGGASPVTNSNAPFTIQLVVN